MLCLIVIECSTLLSGASWYTAMGLGHTSKAYAEPLFQSHLLGGILWALGINIDFDESVYLSVVLR